MNIQISVVLWTIICFFCMLVILQKLLFVPMLRCMDARNARIAGARAKKQKLQEQEEQARIDAEEQARVTLAQAKNDAERMIAEKTAWAKEQLALCRTQETEKTSAFAAELEEEKAQLLRESVVASEELGKTFVAGLFR